MKHNLTNESADKKAGSRGEAISTLENEFKFYLDNQDSLVGQYAGKFIVIIGDKVVGSFDNKDEAYFNAKEQYGLGKFLIQRCEPGTESYTANYTSRVIL